jgi:hypothetical protein
MLGHFFFFFKVNENKLTRKQIWTEVVSTRDCTIIIPLYFIIKLMISSSII